MWSTISYKSIRPQLKNGFFVPPPPSIESTSCVVSHFSRICFAFEINICFTFQSLFLANCFAFQSVSYFSLFRILDKSFRILVNSVPCFAPHFVLCFVPCSAFQPEPILSIFLNIQSNVEQFLRHPVHGL